jgi:hypothetical protein
MMNVESYRRYAADCVRQAQGEETPESRNILLNVALAWLRLAKQTEAIDTEAEDGGDRLGGLSADLLDESGLPDVDADAAGPDVQDEPRRLAS